MIKSLLKSIIFILVFSVQACNNEPKKAVVKTADSLSKITDTLKSGDVGEEYEEPDDDPAYVSPKTGQRAEDFITEPDVFEIQYEAKGDLNSDGLADIAFVRKEKKGKFGNRTVVILLQNKDQTYRLDKTSDLVMPNEYTENDFKIYDNEEVNIKDGVLNIKLYGVGPSGNLFSTFKYFGENLLLTHIETYNVGAGSHLSLKYDILKGELNEEEINTMKEEMPSELKTYKIRKGEYKFESVSTNELIQDVYNKAGNN